MREVRRVAADAGAHLTVAQMDLVLADVALGSLDRDACMEAAQRCVDASRRYGLASLPVALLWLAGAHALGGRGTEMEAVLAEAAAAAPGDARVEADAWGRVRATYHALREDRVRAAARPRPVDGVHARRAGRGVRVPGTDAVGAAAARCPTTTSASAARAEVAALSVRPAGFGDVPLALVDAVTARPAGPWRTRRQPR